MFVNKAAKPSQISLKGSLDGSWWVLILGYGITVFVV